MSFSLFFSLFGYVGGNPIISIDPTGLVKWTGDFDYFGIDVELGVIGFDFYLVSECVNNIAYYSHINAKAGQVSWGIPVALGKNDPWEDILITDTYSQPNPDGLSGIFNYTSAGYVIFELSYGYLELQLGTGHGVYTGKMEIGVDVGLSAGAGWSSVVDSTPFYFKTECECDRWNQEKFGGSL